MKKLFSILVLFLTISVCLGQTPRLFPSSPWFGTNVQSKTSAEEVRDVLGFSNFLNGAFSQITISNNVVPTITFVRGTNMSWMYYTNQHFVFPEVVEAFAFKGSGSNLTDLYVPLSALNLITNYQTNVVLNGRFGGDGTGLEIQATNIIGILTNDTTGKSESSSRVALEVTNAWKLDATNAATTATNDLNTAINNRNYVTSAITNGLVDASVTNGLATTNWVGLNYYPTSNPSSYVTSAITNGYPWTNVTVASATGSQYATNTPYGGTIAGLEGTNVWTTNATFQGSATFTAIPQTNSVVGGSVAVVIQTNSSSVMWQLNTNWALPISDYSSPTFVDIDNDGLVDIYFGCQNPNIERIQAYRNVGTKKVPAWERKASWDVPTAGYANWAMAKFGDLNGDGRMDAIWSSYYGGESGYYGIKKNTGTLTAPSWTTYNSWLPSDFPVSVPGYTRYQYATFPDLNNDGLPDMVLFPYSAAGTNMVWQNTGTVNAPVWTRNYTWQTALGATNLFGGEWPGGDWVEADFADLNGDGKLDFVWAQNGVYTPYLWENTGTKASPAFTLNTNWALGFPIVRSVSFADIDGDGDMDVIIGAGPPAIYENLGILGNTAIGVSVAGVDKARISAGGSMVVNDSVVINSRSDGAALFIKREGTGKVISLNNATNEIFTVLNNGNVGIGDLSTDARFTVAGMGNAASNLIAFTVEDSSFNKLFTVRDGGNVGIGISAPVEKLSVIGNITAATNVIATNSFLYGSGGSASTNFLSATGSKINGVGITNGSLVSSAGGTGSLGLRVGTSTLVVTNGNVGIGTTGPTYKLEVNGTTALTGRVYGNHLDNTSLILDGGTSSGAYGATLTLGNVRDNVYGAGWSLAGATGQNVNFKVGDSSLIGETAYANGTINIVGGAITITAGNGSSASAGIASGGNIVVNGGIGYGTGIHGNVLLASARGNVGIGTTNPASKLSVNGQLGTSSLIVTNGITASSITATNGFINPVQALTYTGGTNILIPVTSGQVWTLLLTNNAFLSFTTNANSYQDKTFTIKTRQDTNGTWAVTWNTNIYSPYAKFSGGIQPSVTTNSNAEDVWTFQPDYYGLNYNVVLTPNLR